MQWLFGGQAGVRITVYILNYIWIPGVEQHF